MVSARPASMRVLHIHHWDIRNLCFLLRIPDTSMIENIIMSSHAPQINVNGLIVVIFGWKILPSRAGLEPTQMCVNSHKACAFASSATRTDLYVIHIGIESKVGFILFRKCHNMNVSKFWYDKTSQLNSMKYFDSSHRMFSSVNRHNYNETLQVFFLQLVSWFVVGLPLFSCVLRLWVDRELYHFKVLWVKVV